MNQNHFVFILYICELHNRREEKKLKKLRLLDIGHIFHVYNSKLMIVPCNLTLNSSTIHHGVSNHGIPMDTGNYGYSIVALPAL